MLLFRFLGSSFCKLINEKLVSNNFIIFIILIMLCTLQIEINIFKQVKVSRYQYQLMPSTLQF